MSDTLPPEKEPRSAAERIAVELADHRRDDIAGLLIDALEIRFRRVLDMHLVLLEVQALAKLGCNGRKDE